MQCCMGTSGHILEFHRVSFKLLLSRQTFLQIRMIFLRFADVTFFSLSVLTLPWGGSISSLLLRDEGAVR